MKINVKHVAKLANLPLSKDDEIKLENQLSETLNHIESLIEIDTKNVQPTNHVSGQENVLREDKINPSLSQKEALSNTKQTYNGMFMVKAVLDD